MVTQEFMKRSRHNDELLFEELMNAIDTIDTVAEASKKTFNQVADVYRTQAINRLTEVLIDAGDTHDREIEGLKSFVKDEMSNHREWCYDNQPLKIKIQKE